LPRPRVLHLTLRAPLNTQDVSATATTTIQTVVQWIEPPQEHRPLDAALRLPPEGIGEGEVGQHVGIVGIEYLGARQVTLGTLRKTWLAAVRSALGPARGTMRAPFSHRGPLPALHTQAVRTNSRTGSRPSS